MKTRQMSRSIERKTAVDAAETDAWIENEVVGCEFPDVRHGKDGRSRPFTKSSSPDAGQKKRN
jgi:hypothetical protein